VSGNPATQIMRVQVLVMDWLVNHIWTQDKRFAQFVIDARQNMELIAPEKACSKGKFRLSLRFSVQIES
jgi:hypothetical protein